MDQSSTDYNETKELGDHEMMFMTVSDREPALVDVEFVSSSETIYLLFFNIMIYNYPGVRNSFFPTQTPV